MITTCSTCQHRFSWMDRTREIWMKNNSLRCPKCRQVYRQSLISRVLLLILIPLPLILRYAISNKGALIKAGVWHIWGINTLLKI